MGGSVFSFLLSNIFTNLGIGCDTRGSNKEPGFPE